jgi:hypothetical protein
MLLVGIAQLIAKELEFTVLQILHDTVTHLPYNGYFQHLLCVQLYKAGELFGLGNLLFDNVHNAGFGDGTKITKLITLTVNDFAHDATHDLDVMQFVSKCFDTLRWG